MTSKNECFQMLLYYFLGFGWEKSKIWSSFEWWSYSLSTQAVFLGISFDEHLYFNTHFANLRVSALKRLNIIKIFSHKSWYLNQKTLSNIYWALIGSVFDYLFFTVSCVSNTCLNLIQKIQNMALRCIYKLNWNSPTKELFTISGVLFLKIRFFQLGTRCLTKWFHFNNKLIKNLLF